MNSLIDIVHEQVDRLASMAAIADIEYSVFCAELVLKVIATVVKHVEPLPEPTEDVKAFVAGYDSLIPQMIQCFDALVVQVEVTPLPRTSVDVEDWTDRLTEIIENDQIAVDALKDVTAPDPIPWDEIEQKRDPCYTTYKQIHVTQIIKHIVGMMDKRPGYK